jgi:predicted RNase H-like nuclease
MSHSPPAPLVAIGADGARGGWATALLYADAERRGNASVWQTRLALVADVTELAGIRAQARGAARVAIDIPIGLLDSVDFRPCDLAARAMLKQRANAVFAPPARYMLPAAGDYGAIRALVEDERQTTPAAKSLSAQAAGITMQIREVDEWVRANPDSEQWLFECHPELSFLALNDGAPLPAHKHSAAGLIQRLGLVRAEFPDAEEQLAAAPWTGKQAELSDLLDAYAALSTALVCARGVHEELGGGERDSEELLMRMAV